MHLLNFGYWLLAVCYWNLYCRSYNFFLQRYEKDEKSQYLKVAKIFQIFRLSDFQIFINFAA